MEASKYFLDNLDLKSQSMFSNEYVSHNYAISFKAFSFGNKNLGLMPTKLSLVTITPFPKRYLYLDKITFFIVHGAQQKLLVNFNLKVATPVKNSVSELLLSKQ